MRHSGCSKMHENNKLECWDAKPIRCLEYKYNWQVKLTGDAHVKTTPLLDGFKYTISLERDGDTWKLLVERDGRPVVDPNCTLLTISIKDTETNREYSNSDVAQFQCELTNLPFSPSSVADVDLTVLMFPDYEPGLSQDLAKMLADPKLTDFSIKLGQDDETQPAVKSILAARSKVFRTMLNQQMKETHSEQMDLSAMPKVVVKQLIEFIHTGITKYENLGLHGASEEAEDELTGEAIELLRAAHCYEIEPLKRICSRFLRLRVSVKFTAELLSLANSLSISDLRDSVLKFIGMNRKRCALDISLMSLVDSDSDMRTQIVMALAGLHPDAARSPLSSDCMYFSPVDK